MKRIYYFLKNYLVDIVVAVVGSIGVLVGWDRQGISLLFVVLTLMTIIYLRSRERKFIFSALTWSKDKDSWMGHGVFQLARVQDAYAVTNADPGYIHADMLSWSDYKLSLDFQIANKVLGVVVRAINLANYIMLQVNVDGIRPHIRVNGGWAIKEAKDAGLVFREELSKDSWYHLEVCCDKGTISIKIFNKNKIIFDRVWEIPREPLIYTYKHSEENPTTYIPFPISLEYGSVGFRNWGDEKAFVKNVLVEKL